MQISHYAGPTKQNPPLLPTKSLSSEKLESVSRSVKISFNAQKDHLHLRKYKTIAVFGPMIDSPPAHPDTVLTTIVYLDKSLNSFGMTYTHLIVDLQLYQATCVIQWNDLERWKSLILHLGMMRTLMTFLGCIGDLMKASGLDVLISASFWGITGILSGKSWRNALRAHRLTIAVLLHNFFTQIARRTTN